MASINVPPSAPRDKVFNTPRIVTLLGSVLVALCAGTGYLYSAYAPQLGARLHVSHTQLNVIALAAHMGGAIFGPVWGRIVDRNGPRIPLVGASICFFFGYLGIKLMYDDGVGTGATISVLHFTLLLLCSSLTGLGGSAGGAAAVNTTAKSFPPRARATTTSFVVSGFGLSAFCFSFIAHAFFPGDTSALLLLLALGTAIPTALCVFVVRPVPMPSNAFTPMDEYELIPSGDVVAAGEALDLDMDEEDKDSAPFLMHRQEMSALGSPAKLEVEMDVHHEQRTADKDTPPDIHGRQLWLTPDFYLVLAIIGICSGTGLMYINNVGSIAQALYASTHVYDDVEASKWQAAQVSILSLGNFAGRIMIGFVSDAMHSRLRYPRAYCFCVVSFLFIVSQVAILAVASVETLWIATLLLGISYGSLWGSSPTVVIEWFGLVHFSENWGYVGFSPLVGGNLFSLLFGRNLDAHASRDASSLAARVWSSVAVRGGLPSEHQCFYGRACYVGSLQVTLVACIVALGLSGWAGVRDGRRVRERNVSHH